MTGRVGTELLGMAEGAWAGKALMHKGFETGWLQGHVWKQSESQGSATGHCY